MAEFCLECWNKINNRNDSEDKYILSDEDDFCEACGQWKKIIVMERKYYYLSKVRMVFWPFFAIYGFIHFHYTRLCIYRNRKKKK